MSFNGQKAPTSTPAGVRLLGLVALSVVLVLVLAGAIWTLVRHSPPGRALVAAPTATATSAPPRVVYAADWSKSADSWTLPKTVHLQSGRLVFPGDGDTVLTIPYQPPVTGYTIDVTMEVDSVSAAVHGGTITIEGKDASGKAQYYAQLLCVGHSPGCHFGQYTLGVFSGEYPSGMQFSDFGIGPYEIDYKVQVAGVHVQFCKGSDCESVAFVHAPTAPLELVIDDDFLVMSISSVAVTTP
jgi:hypothetical protein